MIFKTVLKGVILLGYFYGLSLLYKMRIAQLSCLENPTDRGTWWATVHRVTKSQTQLKQLSTYASTQKERKMFWIIHFHIKITILLRSIFIKVLTSFFLFKSISLHPCQKISTISENIVLCYSTPHANLKNTTLKERLDQAN